MFKNGGFNYQILLILLCSALNDCVDADGICCNGVPCDNPVENAGNKCGCPTNYHWEGNPVNDCVTDEPDTCNPACSGVTLYEQTWCLYQSPAPYSDGCCVFSVYGGEETLTWQTIEVLTN